MKNKHLGSKFDDFLKEESLYNKTKSAAIKRADAYLKKQQEPSGKSCKLLCN